MNVLLIGCCINIENNIEIIKQDFYDLSKQLNKCYGVFYENNSTDNTVKYLKEWEKTENRIKIISEHFTEDELLNMCKARSYENKPCRMEIISMARNKLLIEIEKEYYDDFEYVIMFDMDHTKLLPIDSIINVLNKKYDFDALICKGTNLYNDMYDTFAYRDIKYPFGAELLGSDFDFFDLLKKLEIRNKTELIPVLSAFNGMCIFKKTSIKNIRYSAHPSRILDNIYRSFIYNENNFEKIKQQTLNIERQLFEHYNLQFKKSFSEIYEKISKDNIHNNAKNIDGAVQGLYLYGKENGIFYKNCTDFNYPVLCEHVIFFLELRAKGLDKIYICPELEWSGIWQIP